MIFTTDTVFNTTFLIERPCNTHDVIATLRTAREDGDQVYVRGGASSSALPRTDP